MQTLKIPIKVKNQEDIDLIKSYQKQYSNLLHLFYNQIKDKNLTEKQHKCLKFNNLELLDSWFKLSAFNEAKQFSTKNRVIFGGKKNFFDRIKNLISKEEFQENRLSPIYSIGDKNTKSNRKFQIINEKEIIFKPKSSVKTNLELCCSSKNYLDVLKKLKKLQDLNEIPISYKLSKTFIWITFDEKSFEKIEYKSIKNRIFAIDLNPNYIGYSVVDWKDEETFEILDKGVFSLKSLNDKEKESKNQQTYFSNKRNFEIFEISKKLVKIAEGYKCEIFGIEKLNIKSKNSGKGKWFNRLVNNQWNRNKLQQNIEKRCNLIGIKYLEVLPQYSSFIGNLVYRNTKLPDMILSSLEIGRRAYEFNLQYIMKEKVEKKNIIFPELTSNLKTNIQKSLEELEIICNWLILKELYDFIKNSKCKYRVPFENNPKVFSRVYYQHIKIFNKY